MEETMIPDAGNRQVTIRLENSDQQPPFKYFTTNVVGWQPLDHETNRYVPMVWNPWILLAVPFDAWIETAARRHADDTDAAWSVMYKALDTMPHHPMEWTSP
jgi:hypothetical protein